MRAQEKSGVRWSNVDMVLVSGPKKKIIIGFSAASCLALLSSQTSVSPHTGERKRRTTGFDYLLFTVTITIVTSLSYPARGRGDRVYTYINRHAGTPNKQQKHVVHHQTW